MWPVWIDLCPKSRRYSVLQNEKIEGKYLINILKMLIPRWIDTIPWWLRIHLQCWRPGFNPWVGMIPWRREWLPTPVFLPGEFHGQRSLVGYSQSMGSQTVRHDRVTFPRYIYLDIWVRDVAQLVKNLPANAGDARDVGLISGSGIIHWRRKWQPTPVFLPGKSHGQRSLVGYNSWGLKESDTTEFGCTHTHS